MSNDPQTATTYSKNFFVVKTLDYFRGEPRGKEGLQCLAILIDVYDGIDRFVDDIDAKIAFLAAMEAESKHSKQFFENKEWVSEFAKILGHLHIQHKTIAYIKKCYEGLKT